MRICTRTIAAAALLAVAAMATLASAEGQMTVKPDSLYKRLGGYDAIAAVVDNFVPRVAKDPVLARYFVHSQDTLMHIRQLVVDQICAATGGPCVYIGRDMKTAHKGLGISAAEWDVATRHFTATLDHLKVPAKEKDELLQVFTSVRGDIVEK